MQMPQPTPEPMTWPQLLFAGAQASRVQAEQFPPNWRSRGGQREVVADRYIVHEAPERAAGIAKDVTA
jgi:hypothetical protein